MGRVGDDDIRIRDGAHHAPLAHVALGLADALFDFRAPFLILVFVAHFLLGHQQFFVAFPQLHGHVHGGNQDQPAGHPQRTPGHHLQAVNHRRFQRFVGDALQVVDVGLEHHQRHDQDDEEFGQRLEQFDQRLGREHALEPRRRVHAAELGRQAARREQPTTQCNRPDQGGNQQGDEHGLERDQRDFARVQQEGAHGIGVEQRFTADAEVVAHDFHHVLRQRTAKDDQADGPGEHDGQRIQFFRACDLALFPGVFFSFLRGVFCFVGATLAFGHGYFACARSRKNCRASVASGWY